jgi:hypothetical protein
VKPSVTYQSDSETTKKSIASWQHQSAIFWQLKG